MAGYVHDPPRAEETRYRLYAVVSHIGSSVGGPPPVPSPCAAPWPARPAARGRRRRTLPGPFAVRAHICCRAARAPGRARPSSPGT